VAHTTDILQLLTEAYSGGQGGREEGQHYPVIGFTDAYLPSREVGVEGPGCQEQPRQWEQGGVGLSVLRGAH